MLTPTQQINEIYRVLKKAGSNIVWEILRQSDTFYEWEHYPKDDVYDDETHAQYYYHSHGETSNRPKEHGHFHLFIRQQGIPENLQPTFIQTEWKAPDNTEPLCHLIAISMNEDGFPIRLFTTSRWVTGETWHDADTVIQLLDKFIIDHTWPSWPVNLWLTAMVRLHHSKIVTLLQERNEAFKSWMNNHPDLNPYEDRTLEILSSCDIS
jgi:hypothetical protein